MTIDEFYGEIRKKQFRPVYFIYGEEDYLVEEAVQSLIGSAVDEATRGFNLDIVYGDASDVKDVVALASAYPMLAERRVVIVKEFDRLPNNDQLAAYIDRPSVTTSLVLVAEKVDMRKKPYASLRTKAGVVECKPLYDNRIPEWIESHVGSRGKKITPDGARLLHAHVGNSLRDLRNEIDKLFIAVDRRETINVDDVTEVVGLSKVYNIFELTRAIGDRDPGRSIEIMERMLQSGAPATMMIVMITRHFTTLWKISELASTGKSERDIATEVGVNPYFMKEYLSQIKEFPAERIESNFEKLLLADERLKSSSADHRSVMTVLLHELTHE